MLTLGKNVRVFLGVKKLVSGDFHYVLLVKRVAPE
jgi:hypothetical protein